MTKKPPIMDAHEPLRLKVNRRDINRAIQRDDQECAVAQCARRQPDILAVSVGQTIVWIWCEDARVRYGLSPEQQRKLHAFDLANYFEPGEWILEPARTPLGARRGERPGSNVRTGRCRTVHNTPPLRHVRMPDPERPTR